MAECGQPRRTIVNQQSTIKQWNAGNTVRGNRIDANSDRGLDLDPNGVTANDVGDAASGPNNLQNYPVLSAVTADTTTTTVDGTLSSSASTTYQLGFYASPTCDISGNGEGAVYLGAGEVTTNASGSATFSLVVPSVTQAG